MIYNSYTKKEEKLTGRWYIDSHEDYIQELVDCIAK
jgi:hypothetical protein